MKIPYIDIIPPEDYKTIRIGRVEARKLVAKILQDYPGSISWTMHALSRMAERDLTIEDVFNVLVSQHARVHQEGELDPVRGIYAYRLQTNKILVVVSFSTDGSRLSIVTAARKGM